ncbi:MAG: HigA family addiction module antitoxin [candidate division WOR-3 bacterium]
MMSRKYKPHFNIGPGPFIKEELKARNWRQEDLAAIIGMSLKSVNQLIKNKQTITVETAQLLSKAFGQSAQFWLNLDTNYRLRLKQDEERSKSVGMMAQIFKFMPIKEMVAKGWLKRYKNPYDLKSQVLNFWKKDNLDFSWLDVNALPNLRKSTAYNQFNLFYAHTWFQMAKKCAKIFIVGKYSENQFKQISDDFANYTLTNLSIKKFLKDLNSAGVKFFVLSHLQKTYLDGAAFFDNGNPVIVYTMRYNRIDNFWFTVAHEIAHILCHVRNKNDYFVDNLDAMTTKQEREANEYALKMIKASQIKEYFRGIDTYISEWRVNDCAREVGVSPALVVGVLQYEGKLSRRNLNRLKETVSDKIPSQYWAEKRLKELR